MALTVDQVLALAPDPAAAAAGRKLASGSSWQSLGESSAAYWGECRGSAVYQVRVDRGDLASKCSCPSRKFPCKHALGLLLLAAGKPLPETAAPQWVSEWLEKRNAPKPMAKAGTPDPQAQAKRSEKRAERVLAGLDLLDLWLADLARAGLATLDESSFARMAARLVDAQASGLASRVRRIGELVGGAPSWPSLVLDELGLLALLSHAFRRLESLDAPLRNDLRQMIGFTMEKEEVVAAGDRVLDAWAVIGQQAYEDERFRSQRTWLHGAQSKRTALVLQFAAGRAAFPEALLPGSRIDAELAFWPGANPQRAMIFERHAVHPSFGDRLPGFDDAESFLSEAANALSRQPWLDRLCCPLRAAVPFSSQDGFLLRDAKGAVLPLSGLDHWKLLALSGGRPVDVAGEWDGRRLYPLSAIANGGFHSLRSET
ncbi:MAG TPA: SWIM zinc finger family protein [Myxococcales bacterium]|nr:SWIM zinc finger family protein [Myxococcales bacterium]